MTFGDFCDKIAVITMDKTPMTDEAAKAHKDVIKAMWKLADKTDLEWGLMSRAAYERDITVATAIGMVIGTVSTAITMTTIKKRLSRAPKSTEES